MSEQKLDEAIIQPSEADNISHEEVGEIATLPAPAVYPSGIGVQESDAQATSDQQNH